MTRLNDNELNILKLLSQNIFIPYDFITEKLHIILNIPAPIINKSIINLIEKKYIFLRDEVTLVIPDIYFVKDNNKVNYSLIEDNESKEYSNKMLVDINNLINYLVSKELNFSNSLTLYKKDMRDMESVFSRHSLLKDSEFNLVTYFYSLAFVYEEDIVLYERIREYFCLCPLDKILFFVEIVFPWVYPIMKYCYDCKKSNVSLDLDALRSVHVV